MYRTLAIVSCMMLVLMIGFDPTFGESTATKSTKVIQREIPCEIQQLYNALIYCGEKVPLNQQFGYCWGCTEQDALKWQKILGIRLIIPQTAKVPL